MLKNIVAVVGLVVVALGGALLIQKGSQNLSQLPIGSQLAQVTNGQVGYWNFDDGSAVGKISNARDFSNSSFNTGNDPIGTSAATVCAWIYPRGASTYTPNIVSNGTFSIYIFGQGSSFNLGATSNAGANYPSVGGISANAWNHICVARTSSGSASFYINGSLKTTADSGAPMSGYNSLYIGNRSQGDQGFDGLLDEVRVYNRALGADEVASLASYKGVVAPSTYTLTVTKNGGYVTSSAAGFDCAGTNTCTQTVQAGSQVTLTATPPTGTTITWGGACSGTSTTCSVSVNSNTSVTLNFNAGGDGVAPIISSINATATSNSRGAIAVVTWTTNEAADSYVQYGPSPSYSGNTTLDTNFLTIHSQTITGLLAGTQYHYIVKSKDAAGNLATSPDQTFTTPPAGPDTNPVDATAPTAPTVTATAVSTSQINVTWTTSTDPVVTGAPTSGVAGYKILRDGVQIGTGTNTSYSDTGLSPGTTYQYTVTAYDVAGNVSTVSRAARATTQSNPNPVVGKFNVGDTVQVTSAIRVRLTPISNIITNYVIVGNNVQSANVTGTVIQAPAPYTSPTKDTDGNIWSYVRYADGTTGWSTETYLSLYVAPTTYTLTVTKSGTGVGTVAVTCGTTTCPTAIPAGTSVTLKATPSTTAPTTAGSDFTLWSGISGCSNALTCTFTMNGNTSVTAVFTRGTGTTDNPPTLPTNLAATVVSATQINLTWTPSTDDHGVSGYHVYRNGSDIANVTTGLTGATIAFSNTTLAAGTTYTYTVAAYDTIGQIGAQSTSVTKTTPTNPGLTITSSTGANGTIAPLGAVTVASGGTQAFTITPTNTNYRIATVVVDGVSMTAGSPYTFTNVTANHTIAVTFSSNVAAPTATLTANPNNITAAGSNVTLTWGSTNATSCTGTGFSTGSASPVSGSVTVNPNTNPTNYSVTCSNASGVSAIGNAQVTIGTNTTIVPADRKMNWVPHTNVGVIGGIPNRTSIYTTLNPGATADQIAAAINACPSGNVVFLNAGTYNLSSQIRVLNKSDCTLRGAGPGKTILTSSAWAAILNIGQFPWITEWPADTGITSGGTKGSASINVSSTAGITAGNLLYLEEDNVANDSFGFGSGSANSAGRLRDGNKVVSQIVRIESVVGSTVNFQPALNFDFPSSRNPRAVNFNNKQGPQNFGVEDLTIAGSTGGYGIWWQGCANSWMRNVEVTKWDTFGVEVQYCTNFEIRDSYVHDPNTFNWSKGYSIQLDQSNNTLIENNTLYKYQDGILFQDTSSGNVVAYNALYNSYPLYNGKDVMLASLFGNHTPMPTMNLYEGNYAAGFHSDYYYGPSSKTTLLRNYLPASDPETLQNRIAVNIDSHQWDYNVIGNILGSTGTSGSFYLALPKATVNYANTTPVTWTYGDTSTDNFAYTSPRIYRLGYPYIGNNSSSGTANPPTSGNLGAMDMSVKPGGTHEALLLGNWDAATKSVQNPVNVPTSYIYPNGQPSWWPDTLKTDGTKKFPWPPYNAATHNIGMTPEQMLMKLPSGARLVEGTLQTK